jgi:hypothetical protein
MKKGGREGGREGRQTYLDLLLAGGEFLGDLGGAEDAGGEPYVLAQVLHL